MEAAVDAGRLRPGDALPSVRTLARELEVAPATVSSAVRELRLRGIVTGEQRRRVRIASAPPLLHALEPAIPPGARDVATGNPDPALLPDPAPFLRAIAAPPRLYGEEPVFAPLAALARAGFAESGVDASELAVLSGTLDAVERVLTAQLRAGDRIAVEDPGYGQLLDLVRALGLEPVPLPLDGRGVLPSALRAALARGARAVIVTPRAQSPTGTALDAARASELRAVLDDHPDVLVVEDDHAALVAAAPHHTLTRGRRRWAVARSTAKALGPDLRLALLAGDRETISRVDGRYRLGPGWVSFVLQRLVAALLADAGVQALARRAGEAYAARARALMDGLAAEGVPALGGSGLNVWVPMRSESAPLQALLADGWVAAAGERFRLQSPPAIRITTARLDERDAPALAAAIARAVRPPRRLPAA